MKDLKRFLQENYPNYQAFNTPNWMGDRIEEVYNKNGIEVYYCYEYSYIEIYGLTPEQFDSLLDKECDFAYLSFLRTFTEDEYE